jgi:xanthine dehydrogenase YagR molybdenum-binding subunit
MNDSLVGKPLNRVDGRLKVTGTAIYTADAQIDNIAHAALVASSIAKG